MGDRRVFSICSVYVERIPLNMAEEQNLQQVMTIFVSELSFKTDSF